MGNCASSRQDAASADGGGSGDTGAPIKAGRTPLLLPWWCHRLSDSVRSSLVYRSAFPFDDPTDAPAPGSQITSHPSTTTGAVNVAATPGDRTGLAPSHKLPASKRVAIAAEAVPSTKSLTIPDIPKDAAELALIGVPRFPR